MEDSSDLTEEEDDAELERTITNHIQVLNMIRSTEQKTNNKRRKNTNKTHKDYHVSVRAPRKPKRIIPASRKGTFQQKLQHLQRHMTVQRIDTRPVLSSPRFFLQGTVGKTPFTALIDYGSNVNLINSHFLHELESTVGAFPREPCSEILIEDHQHNRIPIENTVTIPLKMRNYKTNLRFIVHATEKKPTNTFDVLLLGAPFIHQAKIEANWKGKTLMLTTRDGFEIPTILEHEREYMSTLASVAEKYKKKDTTEGNANPTVTCTYGSSDGGAATLPHTSEVGNLGSGETAEDSSQNLMDAAAHELSDFGQSRHLNGSEGQQMEDMARQPSSSLQDKPIQETKQKQEEKTNTNTQQNTTQNTHAQQAENEAQESKVKQTENTNETESPKNTISPEQQTEEGVLEQSCEIPSPMPTSFDKIQEKMVLFDIYTVAPKHREYVEKFLRENEQILSKHATDVGCVKNKYFTIETTTDFKLPNLKPYQCPPPGRQLIKNIIKDWIEMGVIVEVKAAEGCFPLFLVPKRVPGNANKEANLILVARPVIDYRILNARTKTIPQKIPNIVYTIEKLRGKKVYSKFDFANAFNNLRIHPDHQYKTTFITPDYKTYKFTRMPFGLKNAATAFQECLTSILQPLENNAVVYLDDVILASDTVDEHRKLLDKFGKLIKEHNLKISPKKCSFFKDEIEYLSFVCDSEGIRISDEKVKAITEYQRPQNLTQVQAFVGLANWVSRFIPHFQTLVTPFTNLSKKDTKFAWTEECEENFKTIKKAIATATKLHHPSYTQTFHLFVDASKTASGAGLFQFKENTPKEIEDSAKPQTIHMIPIAFYSKKFSKVQTTYSALELEILALLDALKHFRYYLDYAPRIVVHSDAKTITWLLSYSYFSDNSKLMRYSMRLLSLENLVIQHCEGKRNILADALSRQWGNPAPNIKRKPARQVTKEEVQIDCKDGQKFTLPKIIDKIKNKEATVQTLSIKEIKTQKISSYFKQFTTTFLAEEQSQDTFCQQKREKVMTLPNQENDRFKWYKGLLVRKKKVTEPWDTSNMLTVVPKSCRALVLAFFHSYGHLGAKRLHKFVTTYYWFPKAAELCKAFAQGCKICQSLNRHKTGLNITTNMEATSAPNEVWDLDFMTITKSGNITHVLNIQDNYSGLIMSFGTPTQKATQVCKALTTCFQLLGVPKCLRSDHGKSLLESNQVRRMCEEWGVERFALGIPNIPTKNAKCERTNQSMRSILKALSQQYGSAFHEVLPYANYIYNSTPHRYGDLSPYEIFYSRKARISLPTAVNSNENTDISQYMQKARKCQREIKERIRTIQEKNRREDLARMNNGRRHLQIVEGDLVLLLDLSTPGQGERAKKDRPTYIKSPFLVRKRLTNLLVLENILDNRVIHASVNHVKKLVGRGQIFKDLPVQFKKMFGFPFRAFDILNNDLPIEVRNDFTREIPQREGMMTRRRAAQQQRDVQRDATQQPDPTDDEIESDSEDDDDDSDDNADDTTPEPPAPMAAVLADPVPSTSTGTPSVWSRVKDSRKNLTKKARSLLKLKRAKVNYLASNYKYFR